MLENPVREHTSPHAENGLNLLPNIYAINDTGIDGWLGEMGSVMC